MSVPFVRLALVFTFCLALIALTLTGVQTTAAQVTNSPPVAAPETYALEEDSVLQISATAGVLANDLDADGNTLTATLLAGSAPQKGSLALLEDGSFIYTPTVDFFGDDFFTYLASDGEAFSDPTLVTLQVSNTQDAPTVQPVEAATDEDTSVKIQLDASDPDLPLDTLTYFVVNDPSKGVLTGTGANRSYQPDPDTNGVDTFDYKVNDGHVDSGIATVTILVRALPDAPVAEDVGPLVMLEDDDPITVTLKGDDPDLDPITYTIESGPSFGELSGVAPDLTYKPNANYAGPDSITYTVSDGIEESAPATVSINVTPVQDAPTAGEVPLVQVSEDGSAAITLAGSDPDGETLTFNVVAGSGPEHGTLSGTGRNLTYTPAPHYYGADGFEFSVTDGVISEPVTDTVSIQVQPVPDAPSRVWLEGNTIAENLSPGTRVGFLRAEDPDLQEGMTQVYTYTLVDSQSFPDNNLFRIVGDQLRTNEFFDYEDPEHLPQATIQVQAADPTGLTRLAQFTIQITDENESPNSLSDPYNMVYGEKLQTQPKNGVLSNDTDPDGDPLEATLVQEPAHSKDFRLNPDGSFSYEPAEGYIGEDSFKYLAHDGDLHSEVTDVEIFVADQTDPTASWVGPVADGQVYTVIGHQTILLTVNATDDVGVSRVRFYRWAFHDPLDPKTGYSLDIAIDETNPFQAELNTRVLHPEWNQIFIKSFDASGNESGRTWIWIYYVPPHLVYLPQLSQ